MDNLSLLIKDASYVIFDFETTGLYPYHGDRICEIGAIKACGRTRKEFHSMVDPQRSISRGAFEVNGITHDMVAGAPTTEEIMPSFLEFIRGSVLVAYNAGFDIGFLECSLGRDKRMLDGYRVIDVLALTRRLFRNMGSYSLGNVARSLRITCRTEHRAMADAVTTFKLFRKELGMLDSLGYKTVDEIARSLSSRDRTVKTVGDYKRRLIEEAIGRQKKLHITYRSSWSGRTTRRMITPKSIREGYDRTYVIAHCHSAGEERNFRLDGILDAEEEK